MRKTFSPEYKASVIKALWKGDKTVSQISSEYEVHPTQLRNWDKIAKAGLAEVFSDKRKKETENKDKTIEQLQKMVGQREVEIEWLKKKFTSLET